MNHEEIWSVETHWTRPRSVSEHEQLSLFPFRKHRFSEQFVANSTVKFLLKKVSESFTRNGISVYLLIL